MKPILYKTLWITTIACSLFADPTFVTSTFSTGNEGWQPDNWKTNNVNGLSLGNPYLKIAADGDGALGKMITFNQTSEWTGDYMSASVTGIRLDIANMSDFDNVHLRIALGNRASPQQPGGTWWISNTATLIPINSSWSNVFLPITESDMIVIGNLNGESDNDSFADTFSNIQSIRILSAVVLDSPIGDEFFGDVLVDNIALVPEPSTLPLIGLGAGMLLLHRRKKNQSRSMTASSMRSLSKM